MEDHLIFYPASIEVCNEFLHYLVERGWIKKVDGLYDEVRPLAAILEKEFNRQLEMFEKYIDYKESFRKNLT